MFLNRFGEITFKSLEMFYLLSKSSTLAFSILKYPTSKAYQHNGRKATQNQIWFIKKVWFFLLYSSPILLPIDSLFFLLHTQLYAYTTMTFQKNKTFNNNFSTNTKHIEYEKKLQATKKKPMHSKQKLRNLKPKGQIRQMSINKKKS